MLHTLFVKRRLFPSLLCNSLNYNYIFKGLVISSVKLCLGFYRRKLLDNFIFSLVIGLLIAFLLEAVLVKYIFLENFTFSNLFQS